MDISQTTGFMRQAPYAVRARETEDLPSVPYAPSKRRTRVSRAILLGILGLQALMSLRLHNTAFEDEALYLYSGHMELEHLLHGTALQGAYSSYFSGAPVLYPVLAAVVDSVGGLGLVRFVSLAEMLGVTALLYSISRSWFNERVALASAAIFATTESTIFLGNLATFDATCLLLLAVAATIMLRSIHALWAVLMAAPIAALAVAVKYTGLLFIPTIAILPAFAPCMSVPRHRAPRRAAGYRWLVTSLGFVAVVGGLLAAGLWFAGPAYQAAIETTTTNRATGTVPIPAIVWDSVQWGGVPFLLAIVGAVSYAWRVRTESKEQVAPPGGRRRRVALGAVLVGTALLAPLYQAHLHTDISLQKHIGFGLFFAAPLAGFGLIRLIGDYFRRPHVGIAIWATTLTLGLAQSDQLFHQWPNTGQFVASFSRYLKPNARYLVEVPEVPVYYLEGKPDAQPDQFTSTYFIEYTTQHGPLFGNAGYAAAVKAGYFQVIAYNDDVTPSADQAISQALAGSRQYRLAATIPIDDTFGTGVYYIWVKTVTSRAR